ncbi:MAG TPA: hypothetical protein VJA66_17235, partial [Thermoanaerobaculia bacterium]
QPSQPYFPSGSSSLIRSRNGGKTWVAIEEGLTGVGLPTQLSALTIDPTDPQVLYVCTTTGLFKSTDGGDLWFLWNASGANLLTLAIDPSDSLTLYSMYGANFIKSVDGGRTFATVQANRPLGYISPSQPVFLTINPIHPSSIYAVAEGGNKYDILEIFQTDTAGACWNQVSLPSELAVPFSIDLVIDPEGKFLLARTDQGIWEFEIVPQIEPLCLHRPEVRSLLPRPIRDLVREDFR